jgi:hypothetical protein
MAPLTVFLTVSKVLFTLVLQGVVIKAELLGAHTLEDVQLQKLYAFT